MGLPRMNKCCCFDLKTGNILLGSINALMSFLLFAVMIVTATVYGTMERDTAMEMEMFKDYDVIAVDAALSGIYATSIILVFMFLAKFIFDIFFIYGVVMERSSIIKAYYIMWVVFTLLYTCIFLLNVYYFGIKIILTEVFYLSLNVFAMILSYSFYTQLNSREDV